MSRRFNSLTEVERVCFNFLDKCNMFCPFCYCPFTKDPIDLKTCLSIVERCAELGAKIITFGGGDPFAFPQFTELLKQTASLGIIIQIDTNGLGLQRGHYKIIEKVASLISLPLDGPTDRIHSEMRGSIEHFHIVIRHLKLLRDLDITIKINTVVSKINSQSMISLSDLIALYDIDIWSLYQFWPIQNITNMDDIFSLSLDQFEEIAKIIKSKKHKFRLEPSAVHERNGTYLFVSHTGSVYITDLEDSSRYCWLGSIFDDLTVEEWGIKSVSSIRTTVRPRYYSL